MAFDIGLRFTAQRKRLRCVDIGPTDCLAVDQPMQEVQHMGLGRHACLQGHLHCSQNCLFIVMQDECQDVDHLAVSARPSQHLILQLPEGLGQFGKRRTIA